jgi:hypothetical protein
MAEVNISHRSVGRPREGIREWQKMARPTYAERATTQDSETSRDYGQTFFGFLPIANVFASADPNS